MTELLLKLFVRDYKDTSNPTVRKKYGYFSGAVGIFLNLVLFLLKFIAGTLSGSIAVTADAFNNLSDAGSSVISFISFRISAKPADRDHPYGHARIEYVSSMAVSFIIMMVAFNLGRDSVQKIISPPAISFEIISVIALCVSIAVKLFMFFMNRRLGRMINSEVLKATAADSISDVASTSAVLLSTLLLRFTGIDIDAYVGLLVSLFIMYTAIKILRENMNSVLGEAPVESEISSIHAIVSRYPEILGIHDLLVHSYGPMHTSASFHAEVDGAVDIFRTHDAIDNIERAIMQELGIECTIHMDPIVLGDELVDRLRTSVKEIASSADERLLIHDFRCVVGVTHTNLIFDIAVPFEIKDTNEQIKENITEKIKATLGENYYAVITIDRQ